LCNDAFCFDVVALSLLQKFFTWRSVMNTYIVACPSCSGKNRIPADRQHQQPKCGKCGAILDLRGSAQPIELTDHEFQNFINRATLPVMVDFYSPTCGPCKALAPVIHKLVREYLGRIQIGILNTAQHPGTAGHYQIRGVPTLLFFQGGRLVDQIVGAPPEPQLRQKLEQLARR
jgi:thioredoxin 2